MNIYFKNQFNNLMVHLEKLKQKGVMSYDRNKLIEKISEIDIYTEKPFDELNLDFLFNYKIFPDNILISKNEWNLENREIRVGDTIVQQAFFPPIKNFSQKIIFGVRINEILNKENKKGFSYETIEGHAEKGISIFTVENETGKIKFKIHTFSEPGNFLSKIVGSLITIPYQKYCTKKALESVKEQIEKQ
ncbi:DUF1990 family protein [Chishuiella changwenlii]|uniref:DUF1990 family protein n=1 Tax=Chishuiella changwenlii TaxID=1434701 RepID=UPI002FDB4EDC